MGLCVISCPRCLRILNKEDIEDIKNELDVYLHCGYCDKCEESVSYITIRELVRLATIKCPKCETIERVRK